MHRDKDWQEFLEASARRWERLSQELGERAVTALATDTTAWQDQEDLVEILLERIAS